jgi:hypothetical protein
MTKRIEVALKRLAPAFTTRARGEEAYRKLLPILKDGSVVLVIDDPDIPSSSFLDGLLLQLLKYDRLDDVVFAVSDDWTRRNLARISGTRSIDVRVTNALGAARKIKGIAPATVSPTFTSSKTELTSVG